MRRTYMSSGVRYEPCVNIRALVLGVGREGRREREGEREGEGKNNERGSNVYMKLPGPRRGGSRAYVGNV